MKKITLFIVLSLLTIHFIGIARDGGLFRSINEDIDLAACEALTGPVGAEDMSVDPVRQVAYIAADDRRRAFIGDSLITYPNGGIWVLDLSKPDSQAKKLDIQMTGSFHPHGLALRFSDKDSIDAGRAIELYVVNHKDVSNHEVDVFTISSTGELKLRRRISAPEFISPNDLVVVAKDQFFFSNDHGSSRPSPMVVVEDYLGLPLSSVGYFDGEEGHIVISGLRHTNGLALSDNQQTLYVAESTARQISRYQRAGSNKQWKLRDSLNVMTGIDNLEWDPQGNLLTGAHPRLFDFIAHAENGENKSPSEVVRIDVSGDEMSYETLYLNSGEALSGSSVAAQFNQQILIGSVFEAHFLRCSL